MGMSYVHVHVSWHSGQEFERKEHHIHLGMAEPCFNWKQVFCNELFAGCASPLQNQGMLQREQTERFY